MLFMIFPIFVIYLCTMDKAETILNMFKVAEKEAFQLLYSSYYETLVLFANQIIDDSQAHKDAHRLSDKGNSDLYYQRSRGRSSSKAAPCGKPQRGKRCGRIVLSVNELHQHAPIQHEELVRAVGTYRLQLQLFIDAIQADNVADLTLLLPSKAIGNGKIAFKRTGYDGGTRGGIVRIRLRFGFREGL